MGPIINLISETYYSCERREYTGSTHYGILGVYNNFSIFITLFVVFIEWLLLLVGNGKWMRSNLVLEWLIYVDGLSQCLQKISSAMICWFCLLSFVKFIACCGLLIKKWSYPYPQLYNPKWSEFCKPYTKLTKMMK